MTRLTVACVQTNATPEPLENIERVGPMIREAKARGAHLITTPEIVGMLEPKRDQQLAKAKPEENHEVLATFRGLAAELGVWLLVGSVSIKLAEDKLANRSFLLDDQGQIVARYDKIHMFDVQVGDGQTYRESNTYRPGDEAVLVDTPWGRAGMTICYDLRFPQIYRDLAQAGARLLTVPSAFTKVTGDAHWELLLRARAIENGCFVFAPCQTGHHPGNRRTCGHSLIIDPWGVVLADGGTDVGFITATVDMDEVDRVRSILPSLTHDRVYRPPVGERRDAAE